MKSLPIRFLTLNEGKESVYAVGQSHSIRANERILNGRFQI